MQNVCKSLHAIPAETRIMATAKMHQRKIQINPQKFKSILRNSSISNEFMDSIPYAAAALSPARP